MNETDFDRLIQYLDDHLGDLEDAAEGERFRDGYAFARHHVREFQLRFSGNSVECDCDYPFPEKIKGDDWVCGDCGTILLGKDEPGRIEG